MRRLFRWGLLVYLGLALWTQAKEQRGELTCTCAEDCWCKQPGLSFFRWVFPFGHHETQP